MEIRSPFLYIFCWHSTTLVLEESRRCDNRADVILCLTLCRLSGSEFGGKLHGKLHRSLCGLLCLVTGAVQGRRMVPGVWRMSMVFCFQGLSSAQQPLAGQCLLAGQPSCLQPLSLRTLGSSRERRARHTALGTLLQGSRLLSSPPHQRRLKEAGEEGYWQTEKW